jgi:hypothetical protein
MLCSGIYSYTPRSDMTIMVVEYLKAVLVGMVASGLGFIGYLVLSLPKGAGMIQFGYDLHDPKCALVVSVCFGLGMFLTLRFFNAVPH